jgi:hypothetical protein
MEHPAKILCLIALVAPAVLLASACTDETDNFEAAGELRPDDLVCPPCYIEPPRAYLGINTDYNPANITNVSVRITNASGSELRDYGTSYSVPNDPNTVTITDNELCTVGTTGQPPTQAFVEFKIGGAAPTTLYEEIDYVPVTACP